MTETHGVTIGKFYPPHVGHAHLIASARAQCDHLTVIVCDHPDQSVRAEQRARWLAECFSNVHFVCTPDDLPEQPEPWAERTIALLGGRPDVAFTSEPYGEPWAAAMGARHVCVDASRSTHPTSGTDLRRDLRARFAELIGPARRDLARNVVVIGSESSGTSTLAEALAAELRTVCVPEFGREYWVERTATRPHDPWTTEDFVTIAHRHHRDGDTIAKDSTGITVWDTDALATAIWHRRYLGSRAATVDAIAAEHVPDLYIITAPDFPFVQDGTREDGPHRQEMHRWFLEAARSTNAPLVEATGPVPDRLRDALAAIDHLTWPELA